MSELFKGIQDVISFDPSLQDNVVISADSSLVFTTLDVRLIFIL